MTLTKKKRKRERAAPQDDVKVKKSDREEVTKAYSPYEPQFYSTALQSDLFGRNTKTLKETPASDFGSPIPSMIPSPTGTIDDEESARLPSSQDFYKNYTSERTVETRRDRPIETTRDREVQKERPEDRDRSEPTTKKEKGKKEREFQGKTEKEVYQGPSSKPGKEDFPFLVKEGKVKEGKPQKIEREEESEDDVLPTAPSKEKKEKVSFKREEATFTPPVKKGIKVEKHIPVKKEKEIEEPTFYREREPREEKGQPLPKRATPKEQPLGSPATPEFFSPINVVTTLSKTKPDKKMAPSLTEAVTSTPPPQFMPQAVAQNVSLAANQLMPYANPELQNLFAQMVGTITVMTTPPGITETRVVLNSPAFEKSLFSGAEIVFQRYSTAPDSFNITLTGSNAAVNLFNANLPALYSAFQKGHFKFRIGKLETAYEGSRPVFKRKEGGESGGGLGERGR